MKIKPEIYLRGALALMTAAIAAMLFSSCGKNVLYTHSDYLKDAQGLTKDSGQARIEKPIEPDDKLTISIWDHEDLSIGSIHNIYNVQEETGKWVMVDANGEVSLPQVGTVKLEGRTVREATAYLKTIYGKFIKDPIVTVRLMNNTVTVLGEVQRPGVYVFSTDNIRLVDLLGKASGLTDYAKTKKIKIIRGTETRPVDLTNVSYNVQVILPGDVVYVPPTGGKSFERLANKLIPIASLLTALALVYSVSQSK